MIKLAGAGVAMVICLLTGCAVTSPAYVGPAPYSTATTYHPMKTSYYYPYSPYVPNTYPTGERAAGNAHITYVDHYAPDYWVGVHGK